MDRIPESEATKKQYPNRPRKKEKLTKLHPQKNNSPRTLDLKQKKKTATPPAPFPSDTAAEKKRQAADPDMNQGEEQGNQSRASRIENMEIPASAEKVGTCTNPNLATTKKNHYPVVLEIMDGWVCQ